METFNSTLLSNTSVSTSNLTATATAAFDLTNLASLWTSLATFSGLGPDWLKLVVLGGIVETFRRLLSTAWAKIISGFWLSAEIDQSDKAYQWMMAWLSKQPAWNASREIEINARQNKRSVTTEGLADSDDEDDADDEKKAKGVKYMPGYGVKVNVWFEGTWIQVFRSHKELGNGWNSTNHELLNIEMLTRSHKTLSRLLKHARRQYVDTTEDRIDIYTASTYNEWTYASSRQRRPIESVVLSPSVKSRLLNDARDFLASEKWYSTRGIPWRRGYLLHGSPGSGKTSIIHALAGELGCDVYVFSLAKKGLDDGDLCQLVADLPARSIALMEDIDVAFYRGVTREAPITPAALGSPPTPGSLPTPGPPTDAVPTPSSGITLAGLLSAIDGVAAQEGRILFATTNKYTALDPALCRPGRFDVHVEFGLAEVEQSEELFRCFYPATKEEKEKEDGEGEDDDSKTPTLVDGEAGESRPPSYSSSPATPSTPVTSSPSAPTSTSTPASDAKPTPSEPKHHFDTLPSVYTPLTTTELNTLSHQFGSLIPARTFSMAALQGLLMQYKTDPYAAVAAAGEWVKSELAKKEGGEKKEGEKKEEEKKEEEVKKAVLWELWNRVVSAEDIKANAS